MPPAFEAFFHNLTGKGPSPEILTHCRRELLHAVWSLLLDDKFLEAYKHGIVVRCADGVERRIYPRIFTYSADYPEKYVLYGIFFCSYILIPSPRVLLATIRNLGTCLCLRCTTPKVQVLELGMKRDDARRERLARDSNNLSYRAKTSIARKAVYKNGRGVKSTVVEELLSPQSLVPTTVRSHEGYSYDSHTLT